MNILTKETILNRWNAYQKAEDEWDEYRQHANAIMKAAGIKEYLEHMNVTERGGVTVIIIVYGMDRNSGYDSDDIPVDVFCQSPEVGAQYLKDTWKAAKEAREREHQKANEAEDRKKYEELKRRFES